jgi:thiamine biosynthesis lipoprotein
VRDALTAVDVAMSTHRDGSELSRFNRSVGTAPIVLSPPLFDVLSLARDVSARTAGAFDVTVAPLVDAWGFGPRRQQRIVPDRELAELEARVGWQKLALDTASRTVHKQHPQLAADLSGIAKGYGVDRAAAALDALDIRHYMIEAGGEVRVRGRNARGEPWQIAIEEPDAVPSRPRLVVPLQDRAIATSGDYRIFFERGGQRYCHEIDPRTGRPIRNGIASVSIVAHACALADALCKLMVLPLDVAYDTAVMQDLPAYFVVRAADGRLRDVMTPAFAAIGARRYA